MKLVWRKSESTEYPQDVEYIKEGVLLHKNVGSYEMEGVTYYTYDEAQLTYGQYGVYLGEQNRALIDYIAMEEDIEL